MSPTFPSVKNIWVLLLSSTKINLICKDLILAQMLEIFLNGFIPDYLRIFKISFPTKTKSTQPVWVKEERGWTEHNGPAASWTSCPAACSSSELQLSDASLGISKLSPGRKLRKTNFMFFLFNITVLLLNEFYSFFVV